MMRMAGSASSFARSVTNHVIRRNGGSPVQRCGLYRQPRLAPVCEHGGGRIVEHDVEIEGSPYVLRHCLACRHRTADGGEEVVIPRFLLIA